MRAPLLPATVPNVIAILAAGCGGGGAGPPPEERPPPPPRVGEDPRGSVPPQDGAVALRLDREVARPGDSLELTVENRGPTSLEFGVAYRLERWEGRWRWLNRDQAFALIALGVDPGERYEQGVILPADLRPGRYRVAKSFTARAANRKLEAEAEFEVR